MVESGHFYKMLLLCDNSFYYSHDIQDMNFNNTQNKTGNCMAMKSDEINFGDFENDDCRLPKYAICEKRTSHSICPPKSICAPENYDNGKISPWIEYTGNSENLELGDKLEYRIFTDYKRNWQQSKDLCQAISGNLVSILNQDEQDFLGSDQFLAEMQGNLEGFWLSTKIDDGRRRGQTGFAWDVDLLFSYDNSTEVSYYSKIMNFNKPESKTGNCIAMKSSEANFGGFENDDCLLPKYVVCEKRTKHSVCPPSSTCIPENLDDDSDKISPWIEYNGPALDNTAKLEYQVYVDVKRSWHQSKALCESQNASLASITHSKEQNFIESDYFWDNINIEIWLKYNQNNQSTNSEGMWLGAQRNGGRGSVLQWLLNENLLLNQNVNLLDPLITGSQSNEESCLLMMNNLDNFGKWNNINCGLPHYTLCQKRSITNDYCPFSFTHTIQKNQHPYCQKIVVEISSPNYPNNYPSGLNEEYLIEIPAEAEILKIKILAFDLYGSSTCSYGSLEFIPVKPDDASIITVTKNKVRGAQEVSSFFNFKYCGESGYKVYDRRSNQYIVRGLEIGSEYELRGVESLKLVFKSHRYSGTMRSGFLIEYQYI